MSTPKHTILGNCNLTQLFEQQLDNFFASIQCSPVQRGIAGLVYRLFRTVRQQELAQRHTAIGRSGVQSCLLSVVAEVHIGVIDQH
jgi:hypothetical protein